MSSTKSPISSAPTNAGTHDSSTALRSWRHSLYSQMIPAWQVHEIELQCCWAWFVISKWLELWGLLTANQDGVWQAIGCIRRKKRCATRTGGVPDVECRVGKGNAEVDGGVRNVIERAMPGQGAPMGAEECLSSGAGIYAEHCRKGREVKSVEWNRGTPDQGQSGDWGVLNEISKRQSWLRSDDRDSGAPILAEEHHWGGGYESAHHV